LFFCGLVGGRSGRARGGPVVRFAVGVRSSVGVELLVRRRLGGGAGGRAVVFIVQCAAGGTLGAAAQRGFRLGWRRRLGGLFGFGFGFGGGCSALLLKQLLDQGFVLRGGLQLGLQFQRLFPGIDGRFQLTVHGQGIAAIIVRAGAVDFGKTSGGASIVASPVQGHALPERVAEMLHGQQRLILLQQAQALLVGAQPQVGKAHGLRRLRLQHKQQGQAEQPAAPACAGHQQQKGQQQPITLVGPGIQLQGLAVIAQVARAVEQAQAAQVVVIQTRLAIAAAHIEGKGAQARAIETRQENGALIVLEKLPAFIHHGRALATANAQYQQWWCMAAQGLADAVALRFAERRGDQQQTALAQSALIQQFKGFANRQVGAMPRLRHDRRLEGFEQVAAGGHVIGQRHQGMGTARVDDHGGLRVVTVLQQVVDFAPRLLQAVGRTVGGEHFRGQFEHHYQRVFGFLRGLLDALPAGPEQGQQGQQPAEPQGDPRQFAAAAGAAAEQHPMKSGRQDFLPAPGAFFPVPALPQQPAEQRQDQQPFGAQPVRPERAHRRLRKRRRLRRARQSGCCCRKCFLLSQCCSGLLGHSSRITSSTLSNRATASGQL